MHFRCPDCSHHHNFWDVSWRQQALNNWWAWKLFGFVSKCLQLLWEAKSTSSSRNQWKQASLSKNYHCVLSPSIYGAETVQYGFIKTRTSQAETSKGWYVWVSLYRDNKEMKKSLKLFSFEIILPKTAYSSLKNTVFGVIAVKLATVMQRSVILIWWYFRTKGWLSTLSPLPQQHLQRLHEDLNSQEKQDVGQRRISLNNLKIMVQIWNVTACTLSTSQRRNGICIGTEPSGRLSLSYSLDIVSTKKTIYAARNYQGTPQTCDLQPLESISCA